MKKCYLLLIQISVLIFLISSTGFAAPTIDGRMKTGQNHLEWDGYYTNGNRTLSPGGGGQDYDVEKIGLFIDDTTLYFGLQTGFDITGDNTSDDGYNIEGGDFALDFGDDDSFEFGFRYNITGSGTNTDPYVAGVSLYSADSWKDPSYSSSTPWRMNDPINLLASTDNTITAEAGTHNTNNGDVHYTLEASVNLSVLTDELKKINPEGYNFDNVTAHWTMGCGNDVLETTMTKDFNYNPVPEPATILLFGMGLLGAGLLGRKKLNKTCSARNLPAKPRVHNKA